MAEVSYHDAVDRNQIKDRGTPTPPNRPVREHIDVLSSSQEHTSKLLSELEDRLESILLCDAPDMELAKGNMPAMSPLGIYLDGMVAQQDMLNGRIGRLMDRLDL